MHITSILALYSAMQLHNVQYPFNHERFPINHLILD